VRPTVLRDSRPFHEKSTPKHSTALLDSVSPNHSTTMKTPIRVLGPTAAFILMALGAWCGPHAVPPQSNSFEPIGTYAGPGAVEAEVVGPGRTMGSERLYLSYMYVEHTLDLVAIDPSTGQVQAFANPAPGEYGAVMVWGPDGDLYLGTRPHAHILRFNPHTEAFTDLGQPAPQQSYIWQLTVGSDGNIYGCTYPSSKMVRLDLASGRLTDLGRMDPKQQYGRWIAASNDGFVYEAIGTAQAHIVAYQIDTGEHRDILPTVAGMLGRVKWSSEGRTPYIYKGSDGRVYARLGSQYFEVHDWTMHPIAAADAGRAPVTNRLADGRIITVENDQIVIKDPNTHAVERRPYTYAGREQDVVRLTSCGGRLYGSSALPFHLFSVDVSASKVSDVGELGHGEAYSLLPLDGKIYIAAYGATDGTPLMSYDPSASFAPGSQTESNPLFVDYEASDTGWRPQAMIAGPDGRLYVGSVAGYGSVSGPLTIWNPRTNEVRQVRGIVPDQSIVTLAMVGGVIVGGTSIYGGGGSHPTQREAKLFIWDASAGRKTFEIAPVSGATRMTDFLPLTGDRLMGIALGGPLAGDEPSVSSQHGKLFVFDVRTHKIDYILPFGFSTPIYNSVALGPSGRIWGLAEEGIFTFDPTRRTVRLVAEAPRQVTAGFALQGRSIFFASGPTVYRYEIPGS